MDEMPALVWLYVFVPLFALSVVVLIWRIWRRVRVTKSDLKDFNFDLVELIRLRKVGSISTDEFERAKVIILSRKQPESEDDPSQRGFEVVSPRKPVIQSLEDRISP